MKTSNARALVMLLARLTSSNNLLPRFLQMDRPVRHFGTKFLPYLVLILVGLIVEYSTSYILKGSLIIGLFLFIYGYAL